MMSDESKNTVSISSRLGNMVKTAFNSFLFMWHLSLELLWKMIGPIVKPVLALLKPITDPITNTVIKFRDWVKNLANESNSKFTSKLTAVKKQDLTLEFVQSSMVNSITWVWNRAKETSPFQTKSPAVQIENKPRTKPQSPH